MFVLPQEILEKIYIYAHPRISDKHKEYIKLKAAIAERKYFMFKLSTKMFEYYNIGTSLKLVLDESEVLSTIHILSKCDCCKRHRNISGICSRITKFSRICRCSCRHYIRTLLEFLNENQDLVEILRAQDLILPAPIRSWDEFEKNI
jgi:hypothetical protein